MKDGLRKAEGEPIIRPPTSLGQSTDETWMPAARADTPGLALHGIS
jgi:hypothetical protein